jgi:hypothetical protein
MASTKKRKAEPGMRSQLLIASEEDGTGARSNRATKSVQRRYGNDPKSEAAAADCNFDHCRRF